MAHLWIPCIRPRTRFSNASGILGSGRADTLLCYGDDDDDDDDEEEEEKDNNDNVTCWQPKLASKTNINSFGIIAILGFSENEQYDHCQGFISNGSGSISEKMQKKQK